MVEQQQAKRVRGSKFGDLDTRWASMERRAHEAASSLKVAIQLVHEDPAPRRMQVSFPNRKVVLDNLLRVSSCIQQFLDQSFILREDVKSAQGKLQATAGAHTEILHEMEALSSGMEATFKALNEDTSIATPQPSFSDTSLELTKLKQENEALAKEINAKVTAWELAEKSKLCALDQIEKHKEVIAKTTADNMIFLMKLKQTEEQLLVTKAKQEELQSQLDVYRSGWFEEASVEIEEAVKNSLDKASACEFELQTVRKQQDLRVREWERKLETLSQKLNEACLTRASVEERVKVLEEERSRLHDEILKQAVQKQRMEAEARSIGSTVERNNREMANLKAQYDRLLEETKEKSEDLVTRAQKENQLIASVKSVSSQLETQRAINSALMKKKEEVEWLCLEAQAEREKLKQQLRGLMGGCHVEHLS